MLYELLRELPTIIYHHLCDFVFPATLPYQRLKLSASGQAVGGDMLFGRRLGFSGTPSDLLPLELGKCMYEEGSDGRVIHFLTSPGTRS